MTDARCRRHRKPDRDGMGRRACPRKNRGTDVVGSVVSLKVDVWSDVVCPWCYIGKRSFELDVSAPPSTAEQGTYAERLATKYHCSVVEAQGIIDNMTAAAAQEGL